MDTIDMDKLIGPTLPATTPETRAVAIQSINGVASIGGSSHVLGNDNDAALLQGLRQWSDVILVGATTVVAESYGPVHFPQDVRELRRSRGQLSNPPIAILSHNLSLDPQSAFFTEAATPPIIVTPVPTEPDIVNKLKALQDAGAQVIHPPKPGVAAAISALQGHGFQRVVCEGGPTVYAQAFAAQAIDVLHLTIDPRINYPVKTRTFSGNSASLDSQFTLEDHSSDNAGMLFLRYRRVMSGQ